MAKAAAEKPAETEESPAAENPTKTKKSSAAKKTRSKKAVSSETIPDTGGISKTYFVDVVFDIPLDRVFCYQADAKGESKPGKRVMVPFGRRESLGYVIG
jgi:hypothetical protein